MLDKSKIDEIVKGVEAKVDSKIGEKLRRRRELRPQTLQNDEKLTRKIIIAYREAIRLMYMKQSKQEGNNNMVLLKELEKKIKTVNIGTKELGIFKKIVKNYGYVAFIEALETVALNSSSPLEIKPEIVAAEAKNRYYTFRALQMLEDFRQPNENLYVIPLYKVKCPFESKISSGVPVYRLGSGITISLATNLLLDIKGEGVEILETYDNNISVVNIARNAGYEILQFVPSPFSASLFMLWGELNQDNTITLGVRMRRKLDCSSYVFPAEIKRNERLKFDITEKFAWVEKSLSPAYVYVAPEIRKFLSPRKVLILNVPKDFPTDSIAYYIFKRTSIDVLITNGFNSTREYFNVYIFLEWYREEHEELVFTLQDFLESPISGILVLVSSRGNFEQKVCFIKHFLQNVEVIYYNLEY